MPSNETPLLYGEFERDKKQAIEASNPSDLTAETKERRVAAKYAGTHQTCSSRPPPWPGPFRSRRRRLPRICCTHLTLPGDRHPHRAARAGVNRQSATMRFGVPVVTSAEDLVSRQVTLRRYPSTRTHPPAGARHQSQSTPPVVVHLNEMR